MKAKVYYADTDAGGVVYHAHYLRWLEMARCELVEQLSSSVAEYARQGIMFPVARLEIDYLKSAVLGDELRVETRVERVRHVRFLLDQRVLRVADDCQLVRARVMLACIDPEGKPRTLPGELADQLRRLQDGPPG